MDPKNLKDGKKEIELLVEKAKRGDTKAFSKLYDFFVQPVYRYVYFKVKRDDALDLTEDIFLKVWANLKSYNADKGTFSSWIFRIAHNVIVDHYRSRKDVGELDFHLKDEKRENDPILTAENSLSRSALKKAIAQLNKKYQQILLLKYIGELDNIEISKIMNRSQGSLRILKFRALQALKKVLEDMNINY